MSSLTNGEWYPDDQIYNTVDIYSGINVDKLFNEIMKGHSNDFLY